MKIINSFHRVSRVQNCTIDPYNYILFDAENPYVSPLPTEPHHLWYHIKVQIRILGFIWVTVWSVTVELNDEAVAAANGRAREVANTLNCTGL